MKRWTYYVVLFLMLGWMGMSSCQRKPAKEPLKLEEPPKTEPQVQDEPPIAFTRDLYNKLKSSNVDFRKIQFYNDQQIVLTRNLDQNKLSVENGKIKFVNGKYVNEVVIEQMTPCIIDSIESDGFRMRFDDTKNTLKFINNKYSPDFFIFSGSNWKDGSCDILYDKLIYRATCPSCSSGSVADVKLVVKQSELDNSQKKSKVLQGVRVGN